MSNIFTRFFCPGSAAEEDYNTAVQDVRKEVNEAIEERGVSSESPAPIRPCVGCNGMFLDEGLFPVQRIIIRLGDVIRVEGALYCQKCKPLGSFELLAEDDDGDYADSMAFHLDHGWIQLVDDETGEEKYVVSLEEHGHLYCGQCGEGSDWTTCLDCRAQADVKVSRKGKK